LVENLCDGCPHVGGAVSIVPTFSQASPAVITRVLILTRDEEAVLLTNPPGYLPIWIPEDHRSTHFGMVLLKSHRVLSSLTNPNHRYTTQFGPVAWAVGGIDAIQRQTLDGLLPLGESMTLVMDYQESFPVGYFHWGRRGLLGR
jgi:hypothetical protein